MNVVVVGSASPLGARLLARLDEVGAAFHRLDRCDGHDLRETACGTRAAETVRAALEEQAVHALVILAGVCPGKALSDYTNEDLDEVLAVNLAGPIRLIQALLPQMVRPGQVLLLSSIAARGSFDPVYAAAKAALLGFVRSMAQHTPGVRFNALAPGLIAGSGMWHKMAPARRAEHVRQTPTGRLLCLDEVAGAIVNLLTAPAWASLNGAIVDLDGGRR